jgi:glutathione S-transferase
MASRMQEQVMRLFWAKYSPFVRKVMIAAHEAAVADRIELVTTSVDMSNANTALQSHNPLSQIPVLLTDDGSALHDSRTICEYLDSFSNAAPLFPPAPVRWDALTRQSLADGMMDTLILWRQERQKPAEQQTAGWLTTFKAKITAALREFETAVPGMAAAPFDIGHAALGCALGYMDLRFPDLAWRDCAPQLAQWHDIFEARPSAIATHPGPPPA